MSVVLENGMVLVPTFEEVSTGADSLLTFGQITAVLQPAALLKRHLHIRRLLVKHAKVHLHTDAEGNSNWDIFPSSEDTSALDFSFSIGRIMVSDTLLFTYDNKEDSLFFQTGIQNMTARRSRRRSGFRTRIDSYSNTLITGNDKLFDRIPFLLNGHVSIDQTFDNFHFSNCRGTLGEVPYHLDGFMGMHEDSLELRGSLQLDTVLFRHFLKAFPPTLLPSQAIPVTNIPITINCTLDGAYDYHSGKLPAYHLYVATGKGSLSLPEEELVFSSFQTTFTASYHPREKDFGTFQLHELTLKNQALELQAQGKLHSYTNDPSLQFFAIAKVHSENLAEVIKNLPEHKTEGSLSIEVTAEGKLRDFNPEGLKNITLFSHIVTPGFALEVPGSNLICQTDSTEFYLNITPDAFTADSLGKQPLAGSLQTKQLHLLLNDSLRLDLSKGAMQLTLGTHKENPAIPLFYVGLNAHSAKGIYGIHEGTLRDIAIQAHLTQTFNERRPVESTARQRVRDSTVRQRVPDSTAKQSRRTRTRHEFSFADLHLDFGFDRETQRLLRRWQLNGSLRTEAVQWATPAFPLQTHLRSVHVELLDNVLKIHNASLKSGRSDLTLSGELSGIRRALTGRTRLGLTLQMRGDTLDSNELIHALSASRAFMNQNEPVPQTDNDVSPQKFHEPYENLIIIPGNINLQIFLQVSNAYYRHLHLKNAGGSLSAANRRLHIKDFQATSTAGNFLINALYATPHKDSLIAGLDLEMQEVLLEEVTKLLPSMDTLFPMMQSFRGLVDLQLAATTQLDTSMNLILPTLQGACRIKGDGLVLLDGETFSEISRKLFFKKRALNLIDSIRVEATVADSRIDVFPFIMQMDRYKAAIAGSHHIDRTFYYHISLLKSPLPFRLGIDVHGTPENYKIAPGRIRYTDEKLPVLSYRIDSIRINLREHIKKHFETYPVR